MAGSIRDLWQLISGKAVLLPDEIIATELNENKTKLQLCLNYFKPLSVPAKVENIRGKCISKVHSNFVLKLAQYLDLHEAQCYDIYQLYLLKFSTKGVSDIQEVLSMEKYPTVLVEKIQDFYQSERIYLLRCIKHVLSYCDDHDRPHYDVFKEFAGDLLEGNSFIDEIKKQYMVICDKISSLCTLNQQELRGLLAPNMAEKSKQNGNQVNSLQRELCELLEIILLCFKHLELSPETLYDFFNIFKKHGFAGNVGQRSNDNDQSLLNRISFLQILVLIGGLDLELLIEKFSEPSLSRDPLDSMVMKDDQYLLFNDSIGHLSDQQCLSPLFLAWTVVRHLRKDPGFVKLGNRALKLDVFAFIHDMLSEVKLNGIDQSVECLVHNILYGMMNSVLSIFHESTLGDTRFLYKILNQILENPLTADAFWSLNQDEGVRSLLTLSLATFPLQFERPMELLISLARCGETSLQQAIHLLQNMTLLTDLLDHQTVLSPTDDEALYKLVIARKPALYPGSRIVIFENTLGKILNDPIIDGSKVDGDYMSWLVQYDAFDILLGEVSKLLQNFESCSGDTVGPIKRVTSVMRFVGEALRTSPGVVRERLSMLDGFVDGAMRILQKFSSTANPPIHLLGSCFQVLHHSMDIFPHEVWRGIQMSGFLPHFSYHVKDLNEATRALNSGSYGQTLMSRETVEGSYPVTEAFLEFVLHCVDFSAVPESTAGMTAPVLFICQEIFTTYNKWKYSAGFSSDRIGLMCMRIFQKVLCGRGVEVEQTSASTPKKSSQESSATLKLSPDMAVSNSMLFSETGNTLLGIAHTGSEEIEVKLAEQNSAFGGHGSSLVELIKGSLCVLNHLLTRHPTMAATSPSLGRALSTTPGTVGPAFHRSPPESLAKPTHPPHLVKSLVMYVEQRHDCSLAIQATTLLKNIAQTFPISMLSCLGSDVYKVKETYLFRLQAVVDDVGLKVAILDWLTACIQSQPGLIEIFINDDEDKLTTSSSESSSSLFSDLKVPEKSNEAKKSKCLDVVASLMTEEKQGTYECPMELLCASLELIHSLWKEYQMSTMAYLKKLDSFWKSLFYVLDEEKLRKSQDSENKEASEVQMKCISHVIRILALEIFHSDRNGSHCSGFVEKMNSVIEGDGILRWSEFIQRSVTREGGSQSNSELLLLAWRDFLVILASLKRRGTRSSIAEMANRKDSIMLDLLDILKVTLSSPSTVNLKTSNILSSLIVILVNRWHRTLEKPRKIVESSCVTLEGLLGSPVIRKCDSLLLSLVSSLVIIFKQCKSHFLSDTHNTELIKRMMDIICRLLQSSLLYREGHEFISDEEGRKKMKIFENSSKLKLLPIAVIHLLTEILGVFPVSFSARKQNVGSSFSLVPSSPTSNQPPSSPPLLVRVAPPSTTFVFDLLGHYSVVQCLLSWCTYSLTSGEDLDLVQAIFMYFIRLARTERGAEMLSVNAINDQLGIYVHQLYFGRNQSTIPGRQMENMSSLEHQQQEGRISTYLLFTQLTCQLLVTLKAFYLDKALEYLGIHRDRFHGVLENFVLLLFARGGSSKTRGAGGQSRARDSGSRSPFGRSVHRTEEASKFSANLGLYELEVVCHFINELARYNVDWKTRTPDLMQTIMTRLCVWTQKSAGLLLLPRFMQSTIESQRSDHSFAGSTKGDGTPQSKHIFTPEESSQNTLELLKIQQKILSLIAINLNTMKRFTVPLEDIIYQRLEDLPISESFVLVDFSNPSIDENSMPTFGMMVSVFNFCIDLLYKVEGPKSLSPHKPSTPKPIAAGNLNKSLVMFTMDQVLYLMMSHASHCLKNPKVSPQEKQILKSYLNNELSSCLNAVYRHFRSGSPSPVSARRSSVGTPAPLKFNREHQFFSLADQFTKHVLK